MPEAARNEPLPVLFFLWKLGFRALSSGSRQREQAF